MPKDNRIDEIKDDVTKIKIVGLDALIGIIFLFFLLIYLSTNEIKGLREYANGNALDIVELYEKTNILEGLEIECIENETKYFIKYGNSFFETNYTKGEYTIIIDNFGEDVEVEEVDVCTKYMLVKKE
ncbi:MAG: hypothetical protein ACE5RP_00055 [Nitrosopumilus sp.]